MSAVEPVMTAVQARMAADTTLTAMLAADIQVPADPAVLNYVAKGQTYPYVLTTDADEQPWDTIGGANVNRGYQIELFVHVFSQAYGDMEANLIRNRVVQLFAHQPLTVVGYSTVIVEYRRGRMIRKDVEKVQTRHIPIELSIKVHP